ncbi:MAG: hypothetical protein M3Z96_12985 [Pseudomonadota bacterium]|nr:hypothetical protein [Pseudomonadota bacterium]
MINAPDSPAPFDIQASIARLDAIVAQAEAAAACARAIDAAVLRQRKQELRVIEGGKGNTNDRPR